MVSVETTLNQCSNKALGIWLGGEIYIVKRTIIDEKLRAVSRSFVKPSRSRDSNIINQHQMYLR